MKIEMSIQEFEQVFAASPRSKEMILQGQIYPEKVPSQAEELLRFSKVCHALREGRKIDAIKLVREFTGSGLKEAKDAVEGTLHRSFKDLLLSEV